MIMRRVMMVCLLAVMSVPAWSAMDPWAESYRLEALTEYEGAVQALQPLLDNNARHEFALLRRGWLNYLRGAHNASLQDYQQALDINPRSLDARLGLTLPLLAQQRWREVASHANKALEVAPWNYYAHVRLMIAEEGEKKWETLVGHAKAVHQRYPSDATVLVYLARAYDWLKNDKDARAAYQQVLERVPGHIEASQYVSGARR